MVCVLLQRVFKCEVTMKCSTLVTALTIICAATFMACSGSPKFSIAPTNNEHGYCGSEVLADYNAVTDSCGDIGVDVSPNAQQLPKECLSGIKSFQAKYPRVNCYGSVSTAHSAHTSDGSVKQSSRQQVAITHDLFQKFLDNVSSSPDQVN